MNPEKKVTNIVGTGLAGLSAAICLAKASYPCRLFSVEEAERAQSVLAEGGINAALDTMGENDDIKQHFADTIKGGAYLCDEEAVAALTENAPEIVKELFSLGVPFENEEGRLILRNFGGQKKKRTAYAKSSTGKVIMTALIDEARKYEAAGLIERFCHHEVIDLILEEDCCKGLSFKDLYSGKEYLSYGPCILCIGGMNGLFVNHTTGTLDNNAVLLARLFKEGLLLSDLEFIQYHPTTIDIGNKRLLISEAARGEGGRLFIYRDGKPCYFMEEKYPELGNLMPRDVISREMASLGKEKVYLDLTGIRKEAFEHKLSDLREEVIYFLGRDPEKEAIEVSPGIHFFMGGIHVDRKHRCSFRNLYAAGECASIYHGANRLGGNSMLGAIYGGRVSAQSLMEEADFDRNEIIEVQAVGSEEISGAFAKKITEILLQALSIIRDAGQMEEGMMKLEASKPLNEKEENRLLLAKACLKAAMERKESRGAHYRTDYPECKEEYRKKTVVSYENGRIEIRYEDIPMKGGPL